MYQIHQRCLRLVLVGFVLGGVSYAFLLGQSTEHQTKPRVRTANVGTYEEFLKKRLPDLSSDKIVLHSTDATQRFDFDQTTGLVPPKSPFGHVEKLPTGDPRVKQYEKELREFLRRRQQVIQIQKEYYQLLSQQYRLHSENLLQPVQPDYFASKVAKWNGPILWAPAAKSTDINLQFGDEARAVFGPIPPFDTTQLGKVTRPDGWTITTGVLVGEVEGNQIELKPNMAKPGNPLEFQHRDAAGNTVKWTTFIDKCDKPSLAGGVTPCGTSSRISRAVKGNVEWIALARKTKSVQKLTADPYWQATNSAYELLGYIGFNRVSGEVAFFDGAYNGIKFNWDAPTVSPGGMGYSDDAGRTVAARTYDDTFRIGCVGCHDNKKATDYNAVHQTSSCGIPRRHIGKCIQPEGPAAISSTRRARTVSCRRLQLYSGSLADS
jgi:hypothetical protein